MAQVSHTMRVCFSGNGQGALAAAIREQMGWVNEVLPDRFEFVDDDACHVADIAISTTGGMLIREAQEILPTEHKRLYEGNFLLPRQFTERHVRLMVRHQKPGLIIHIGSNAAWYGNINAEDYAAFKTALRKYLELRARDVKQHGIRISLLGFGGIEGPFWEKATAGSSPAARQGIVSGTRKMLTLHEAAQVVMSTIQLPPNVCVRDALIVSTDYQ